MTKFFSGGGGEGESDESRSLEEGGRPRPISSSWLSTEEAECQRAYDLATEVYMKFFDLSKLSEEVSLMEAHEVAVQKSTAIFNDNAVGDGLVRHNFEKRLHEFITNQILESSELESAGLKIKFEKILCERDTLNLEISNLRSRCSVADGNLIKKEEEIIEHISNIKLAKQHVTELDLELKESNKKVDKLEEETAKLKAAEEKIELILNSNQDQRKHTIQILQSMLDNLQELQVNSKRRKITES